jgi:cell wall assembly regulator SMI1
MAKKASIEALESLLVRLEALRQEIDAVEEASPGDRSLPYPGASDSDIAAQEKRLRFAFPPSYRAFLKIHNGWRNFSYDWSIMGVSGAGFEKAQREWTREAEKFDRQSKRRKDLQKISQTSKSDPSVIFWPEHVPLAVDYNGGFRVFDRNRPGPDGEYDIAEVYAGSEEALNREPHFIAIVNLAMEIARRELVGHGRSPDTIEKNALKAHASGEGASAPSITVGNRKAAAPKGRPRQSRASGAAGKKIRKKRP